MNKRKATDCKFIRESNSNPGYNKYIVTVKECDGTTSQVPAYGKDMQDALSRLVWTERGEKMDSMLNKLNSTVAVFAFLLVMTIATLLPNTPLMLGIIFGVAAVLAIGVVLFERYINKN